MHTPARYHQTRCSAGENPFYRCAVYSLFPRASDKTGTLQIILIFDLSVDAANQTPRF